MIFSSWGARETNGAQSPDGSRLQLLKRGETKSIFIWKAAASSDGRVSGRCLTRTDQEDPSSWLVYSFSQRWLPVTRYFDLFFSSFQLAICVKKTKGKFGAWPFTFSRPVLFTVGWQLWRPRPRKFGVVYRLTSGNSTGSRLISIKNWSRRLWGPHFQNAAVDDEKLDHRPISRKHFSTTSSFLIDTRW